MAKENKSVLLGARVTSDTHEQFNDKCKKLGRQPSTMLREIYNAFIEDRLTIEMTDEQKTTTKGVYKNVD